MAKARFSARGMTCYIQEGISPAAVTPPHQEVGRAQQYGALCAEGLAVHGIHLLLKIIRRLETNGLLYFLWMQKL